MPGGFTYPANLPHLKFLASFIYLFIYYNYNLMAKKKLRIHRIKSHEEEVEEELRSLKIKNTTLN